MSPHLSLETISLFFAIALISVAIDLWLVRAWKRRREKKKRERRDGSFVAASSNADPSGMESAARDSSGPSSAEENPVHPKDSFNPETPPEGGPEAEPAAASEADSIASAGDQPSKPKGTEIETPAHSQSDLSIQGKTGRFTHVQISMDIPEGETIQLTLESTGTETFRATASKTGAVAGAGTLPPGSAAGTEREFGSRIGVPAGMGGRPAKPPDWRAASRSFFSSFVQNAGTSGRSLFILALLIFLFTRLIGLTRFPIYFFTDEAVQANFAADLAENHLKTQDGEFLPTFLENAGQYEMNISVYVQIIPYLLYGKSEFVTRGVSVFFILFGMAAFGLLLKRAFRLPLWWSGVLMLSIAPAWFVHSRTAFEPGESIAFYILFLYFYSRYRSDSPWWLLPALFFGALSAYTYSPSQLMVAVTGALLLITDARYHWRHKKVALAGLFLLFVLSLPYFRFLDLHPTANKEQLGIVSSYWVRNIPLAEKMKLFFTEYLRGLDPRYWFLANPPPGVYHDIIRHLMKGYGHLFLWSLPFVVIGLLLCLWNIRSWPFRLALVSLLAAPTGGAIAQITITRTLVMVVPVSLLATLGIGWVLALFERVELPDMPDFLAVWRGRFSRLAGTLGALRASWSERTNTRGVRGLFRNTIDRARQSAPAEGLARANRATLALALFAALASINLYMLWDSLANGSTWYNNYTLYGMQYGGEQLTSAMVDYKRAHPDANLIVSPSWANGTDEIFRFFLPEGFPFRTGTVEEYMQNYIPIEDNDILVMTAEEYTTAVNSGRFAEIRVDLILDYPNGLPGFYFTHPRYVDNIQEIIAAEKAELSKPVEEVVTLGGETVRVVHSRFDMGDLSAAFDGDPDSLIRTMSANPMALDFYFFSPHSFASATVRVGGAPTRVTATFYPLNGGDPVASSAEVERSSTYRDITIQLPEPIECTHIRLEILTVGEQEPTHVHVYEIKLGGAGWSSGTVGP